MCRDCYREGPAELAYRQVVRNIDGVMRCSDFIPRRHRKLVERCLEHRDVRVRAYAAEIIARDAAARREHAAWAREEERLAEEWAVGMLDEAGTEDERAERELEVARAWDQQIEWEREEAWAVDEEAERALEEARAFPRANQSAAGGDPAP